MMVPVGRPRWCCAPRRKHNLIHSNHYIYMAGTCGLPSWASRVGGFIQPTFPALDFLPDGPLGF